MFDSYRLLFLRINVAIIQLAFSLSSASTPMTGIATLILVAAIKLLSLHLPQSMPKCPIWWRRKAEKVRSQFLSLHQLH